MNSLVYLAFFACIIVTVDACAAPVVPTNATAAGRKKRDVGFSVDSESLLSDDIQASVTFTVVNLEETDDLLNVVKSAIVKKVNSTILENALEKAFNEDPLINSQTKTQTYFLESSLTTNECTDLKHAAKNIAKKDLLKVSVKC